jgi:hypothetical protein
MAVINYRKELVSFDKKIYTCGTYYSPAIKFFIHVWQRATCLQDVLDTFSDAFETSLQPSNNDHLELNGESVKGRASRWRRKGIPLKKLSRVETFDYLKRFALREMV